MHGHASVEDPAAFSEDDLWQSMKGGGSQARDQLFSLHLPFARALAGRQFRNRKGSDTEFSDFLQLACAGLLEAMDSYDPSFGIPFRGFASRRINGSILDGIAKMSEVREQVNFRTRVRSERLRSLTPKDKGDTRESAVETLVEVAVGLALGFMLEGTSLYQGENQQDPALNAYESLAWKGVVRDLASEMSHLPDRERRILELHYVEGLCFNRISELFEISTGRISQLHRMALGSLKTRMNKTGEFRFER